MLAVVLAASAVVAQVTVPALLTPAVQTHVRSERFQIVTSVRGLPLGVREELQALFGGMTLELAEPGAKFQATDDISDPTLPIRRLGVAGCSQDHCLVYYERGGYARTWQALLFRWRPTGTDIVAGGKAPGGLRSVDDLRTAFLTGRVTGPSKSW